MYAIHFSIYFSFSSAIAAHTIVTAAFGENRCENNCVSFYSIFYFSTSCFWDKMNGYKFWEKYQLIYNVLCEVWTKFLLLH